jgi:hypothetical protein
MYEADFQEVLSKPPAGNVAGKSSDGSTMTAEAEAFIAGATASTMVTFEVATADTLALVVARTRTTKRPEAMGGTE